MQKNVNDLLTRINMLQACPVSTSMSPTPKLSINAGTPLESPTEYKTVLGSLQYLAFTPDIAYTIKNMSQFKA